MTSSLSLQEKLRLNQLERVVEDGLDSFLKVGHALMEIRSSRLYRGTHETFEVYCRDRWKLSLSRCNQLIGSAATYDDLVKAIPGDSAILSELPEHVIRPLSRLEPQLRTATWELLRRIEERPAGTTIERVVDSIREAIADGWQGRAEGASGNGTPESGNGVTFRAGAHSSLGTHASALRRRAQARESGLLGNFFRAAGKIRCLDAEAVALADDRYTCERHLRTARQLATFLSIFIAALEKRLASV